MANVTGSSGNDFVQLEGGGRAVPSGYNDIQRTTLEADRVFTSFGEDIIYSEAGDDEIDGGNGGDSLFGGRGADTINGSEGADSVDGGAGDDFIEGFSSSPTNLDGNDTLRGGAGDDTIRGDNYGDLMTGGTGADLFIAEEWTRITTGGEAFSLTDIITDFNPAEGDRIDLSEIGISDATMLRSSLSESGGSLTLTHYVQGVAQPLRLRGFTDVDALLGAVIFADETDGQRITRTVYRSEGFAPIGSGAYSLFGGLGDDTILGSGTTTKTAPDGILDRIFGGLGDDEIDAGAGDDLLHGGAGADTLEGGDGIDRASYVDSPDGVVVNLNKGTGRKGDAEGDSLVNIEALVGSDHDDRLIGTARGDAFYGGAGRDTLEGRGGKDVILGEGGRDLILGGNGKDTADGGNGDDTLTGEAGADELRGGSGDDLLEGGAGADILSGGPGLDTLTGGAGADQFLFDGTDMVVTDFDPARDIVVIEASATGEAATLRQFRQATTQDGADLVYDFAGDGLGVIVLENTTRSDLNSDNLDFA